MFVSLEARSPLADTLSVAERIPLSVDEALGHSSDTDFAIAMSNLLFARVADVGVAGLTAPERFVLCLDELEREVNNGGFEQYFLNSSGDLSLRTPDALRALGAPKVASIVEAALAVFPSGRPASESEAREAQLAAFTEARTERLQDLDGDFLTYPEPLAQLERNYVQAHRADFRPPKRAGRSIIAPE